MSNKKGVCHVKKVFLLVCAAALMLSAACTKEEAKTSPTDNNPGSIISVDPSPVDTTPEPEYETVYYAVIVDVDSYLNVRSSPSTSGTVVGKAKQGEKYKLLTEFVTEKWHEIDYNGVTAYISSDYASVKAEVVEVTPTPAE